MHTNNKGMVLVIVLMLLGVIAGLAVYLLSSEQGDIKRTEIIFNASQAMGYLKGAEIWANNILKGSIYKVAQDDFSTNPSLIHFPIVMPSPPQLPQAKIQAVLFDAQGQFYNINNLSVEANLEGFKYFLQQGLNTISVGDSLSVNTMDDSDKFVEEIYHWSTQTSPTIENDAQIDGYYLNRADPCRVPHQLLASISELTTIRYFNKNIYNVLLPYIIALPEVTPININSVTMESAKILMTLGKGLPLDKAKALIKLREGMENRVFESAGAFLAQEGMSQYHIKTEQVATQSRYFLLTTRIALRGRMTTIFTLFSREDNKSKINVKIIWEKSFSL